MQTKFDFERTRPGQGDDRIVYVRSVEVADLPDEIQQQAMGARVIYALHDTDGARLALVKDRRLAFLLARENNFSAVSVH